MKYLIKLRPPDIPIASKVVNLSSDSPRYYDTLNEVIENSRSHQIT